MDRKWWKESIVYQIYPSSFQDSDGDGIGDLNGIRSRLDYLKDLGVNVLWLCPVMDSPMDDNGYDISNYQAINPRFGTMEDFDALLAEAHQRGIRIVMDLVVNHTSDEHPWFIESRKSVDNPYRDYYIWKPGKDGHEPNNWGASFGGSAWKYDPQTDMYYLHLFSPKQPDLNWENPKVRDEVFNMMTWWFDKGIDGFRMDVISMISKDQRFPDGEKHGLYGNGGPYYVNGPRIHEFLQEMNRRVLSKYDIMTVGETPGATVENAPQYAGLDGKELNMVFQFEHVGIGDGPLGKWTTQRYDFMQLKKILSHWQTGLDGKAWNSLFWDNHDQPRIVSRLGDEGSLRKLSAKMLATALHGLRGTPYIYQGEEIGMTNAGFTEIGQYRDIETLNVFQELRLKGKTSEQIYESLRKKSRDNARTPMQWDCTKNGGFTSGTPWISVNENFREINTEDGEKPDSVFQYYRKLIELRKQLPVLSRGHFEALLRDDGRILAYRRVLEENGKTELYVVCNFFREEAELPPGLIPEGASLLLGNYETEAGTSQGENSQADERGLYEAAAGRRLRPYECFIALAQV